VPVVSLRTLTKSYGGGPPALRDVTLEIEGGVTGLLGPNGAGKSTMIQCVLGLLPDFEGDATVLGLDARRQRRAIRRRVGFMPETDAYLPDMTGIRAVRYLGQLTGMPYNEALRRAHEMLYHVGLGEAIYRQVKDYSTGMRQRFKLAQALVHDPELIFLDEPLAGLDPKARDELLALITDLARQHGKHVIWSSHILPDVQKVAEAVVVLHEGRSRGTFRLEDLQPRRGLFGLDAEGALEGFEERLRAGDVTVVGAGNAEDADETRGPAAGARRRWTVGVSAEDGPRKLFELARAHGVRIRRLGPVTESLEDVFMRILGDGEAD
jgi:ABC-2 type transport system ATP-binding protein